MWGWLVGSRLADTAACRVVVGVILLVLVQLVNQFLVGSRLTDMAECRGWWWGLRVGGCLADIAA